MPIMSATYADTEVVCDPETRQRATWEGHKGHRSYRELTEVPEQI